MLPCSVVQDLQGRTEDFHSRILRACQRTGSFRLCETANDSMNIDDSQLPWNALHNFRITRLWTPCTRLIRKNLFLHKFH